MNITDNLADISTALKRIDTLQDLMLDSFHQKNIQSKLKELLARNTKLKDDLSHLQQVLINEL